MTEDEDFKWVPEDEFKQHIADGWKVAHVWENAGHHLRYAIPMYRAASVTWGLKA